MYSLHIIIYCSIIENQADVLNYCPFKTIEEYNDRDYPAHTYRYA